jgi:hypothetical protein
MADPRTRPLPVEPSKIAGADLPKFMRDDWHRKAVFTALALFTVAVYACLFWGVAAVVDWVTSLPALVLSLADMVVAAR